MNESKEIEMILKLLEEKKITTEEAKMLIEALKTANNNQSEDQDTYENDDKSGSENVFCDDFDDVRTKFSNFGFDIKDAILDKMSEIKSNVFDSLSFDIPSNTDLFDLKSDKMDFELNDKASISIEGTNSSVIVKHGSGDKVLINFSVKSRDYDRIHEIIEIQYSKDFLGITVDDAYKERIVITLELPDIDLLKLKVETTNGPISISDVKCEQIHLEGTNGSISLRRCTGNAFKAETSNGSVRCEQNIFDESIIVESSNGAVYSDMDNCKLIDMETTNGSIKFYGSCARSFKAETTNGSVIFDRLNPYQSESKFLLMGETTNGSVTAYINRNYGVVFECSSGRHGNIRLGRNFNMQSMQRNSIGRISYAKGESRYAYKSDIVAAVETKTSNGTIIMEFV